MHYWVQASSSDFGGIIPQPRSGHSAVNIGKSKVVVFGGLVDKKFLSDVVVYDIENLICVIEHDFYEVDRKFTEDKFQDKVSMCISVVDEREEEKARVHCLAGTVNSQVQEAKSEVYVSNELSKTLSDQSNGFLPPHGDMQPLLGDQRCSSSSAADPLAQDFAFPTSNERQNQQTLDNKHYVPSHSSNHYPLGSQSSQVVSSNTGSSSAKEFSGSQNDHHALVPHETSRGLSEVLEALEQARLSLRQKMSSSQLTENGSVGKAIESFLPASKVRDRVEIPVGCSGLFRVPTDYVVEAAKANIIVSGSRPSLANYNPTTGLGVASDDKITSNPVMDTRSIFSADNFRPSDDQFLTRPSIDRRSSYSTGDRLLSSQYIDTQSRISTMRPSFDGNLDAAGLLSSRPYTHPDFSSYSDLMSWAPNNGRFSPYLPSRSVEMSPNLDASLPSSSQYAYPNFSSYPDPMPRVPTHEGLSTFRTSRSAGTLSANYLPFHNDHTRPYMYR